MIQLQKLSFAYPGCQPVLHGLDLTIDAGSYVTIMGANGTGKSTLALLLKGLQAPTDGEIIIDGIPSDGHLSRFEFMKRVGIVFQNPDNTIVTTTVEAELAFGLENIGIPRDEMVARIDDALKRFHLAAYRHTNPTHLSGGEKQRLSLASTMAMRPAILVLDEPTALLDPPSRKAVTSYLRDLVNDGTTVIHITQFSGDAACSDRVIELSAGRINADGTPKDMLPQLCAYRSCGIHDFSESSADKSGVANSEKSPETALILCEHAGYYYEYGTPFAHQALEPLNHCFIKGSATAILGPSGSGKSTLLELAAGLTEPTTGVVTVSDNTIRAMAFQLPEDQMFGQDVASYVSFGPRNCSVHDSDMNAVVDRALETVGLAPDIYRTRDPLALSGGERRLVALAGVFAMRPDILILDEPTAGLDRNGMERVIECLTEYIQQGGTVLFSTHDFEVAHALASHALVLDRGKVETHGQYADVLNNSPWIRELASQA